MKGSIKVRSSPTCGLPNSAENLRCDELSRILRIPDQLGHSRILWCFSGNRRLMNYSRRLFEAGLLTLGDLNGKTLHQLNALARTTSLNLTMLAWYVETNYPVSAPYRPTLSAKNAPAPSRSYSVPAPATSG